MLCADYTGFFCYEKEEIIDKKYNCKKKKNIVDK